MQEKKLFCTNKIQQSTIDKARIVKSIVDTHFEEGRQDRSRTHIWRIYVRKQLPMSKRTFWRLLRIAEFYKDIPPN